MADSLDGVVLGRLVAARAEAEPDRRCLVFENGHLPAEHVSLGDIAIQSNKLAHELRTAGLRKGDRVGVILRNHPEFLYALVACSKLGLVAVPVDPRARGEKLRYFLTFAECAAVLSADYVVTDEAATDVLRDVGARAYVLSTPEGRTDGLAPSPAWPSLNEVLDGPERPDTGQYVDRAADPFELSYTSGTTGDPKAIVLTYERMPLYLLIPTAFFGYRADDVPYTGLSLTHGNALVVTLLPALTGAVDHSVFSRRFTRSRLWDVCIEYGCTTWSNLGGIASAIYGEPAASHDRMHRVRMVVSAGMSRELWQPFEERFGVRILEWYGTMEGGAFAYNPPGAGPVGSFGKPPAVLEMAIVDDDDQPLPPGTIGELVGRPVAGAAQLEYFKNADASAHKTRGGWMHTSDMCWRDEEGWYYFAHRKEEGGIRRMGEFVPEGFVRRIILEHPDVVDAHVYGVPSRTGAPGESDIVVAIVVREPQSFEPAGLFEHCERMLERSHVPDYVQVVGELPKTASEKVQTRFLAAALDATTPGVHVRRAASPT
jgi:acyl-CoA synthetase (AMP-forming)/AMP-acid ligase II